jgi:uncharacterized membrane protein YgdD (TMEM256/DUF423 family)
MAFGAFGSHGLRSKFPNLPPTAITSWSTGSSYLIYNGIALLALSLHPKISLPGGSASSSLSGVGGGRLRLAGGMIIGGALAFSGSIFALVLFREKVGKVLGPVTPLGGLVMIAG